MPHASSAADAATPTIAGLAHIARMVYEGADRDPFVASLAARISNDARDAAAFMDLSMLLQLTGNREQGLAAQAQALDMAAVYRCVHGSGTGLRVLALVAAGDFMSNTPLDFLFDGSDTTVYYVYLSDGVRLPAPMPQHDVAYVGVAESDTNRPLLGALAGVAASWPRPIVNANSSRIAELSRDHMWELFRFVADVVAPRNARVSRAELTGMSNDESELEAVLPAERYPIIVRPLDSHAGHGLVKIEDAGALQDYVAETDAEEFYIAPFVDYRSADGCYRKYRIVFIAGRPFIAHLGISDHWMVHYLNAGMHESEEKRAEEAECMERFDEQFAARHRDALGSVASRIGLDYFAVDCAATRDGRLLLFEAGTGMIVHAMDSPELFPYKQRQMKKIFHAFLSMLGEFARGEAQAMG